MTGLISIETTHICEPLDLIDLWNLLLIFHSHFSGAELLNDLEEQMEVARVQLGVVEAMNGIHPRTPEVEQSILQVNFTFDFQLYRSKNQPFFLFYELNVSVAKYRLQ